MIHRDLNRQIEAGYIRREGPHSDGFVRFYVDTLKTKWRGGWIYNSQRYRRKLENAIILSNTRERVKVIFV